MKNDIYFMQVKTTSLNCKKREKNSTFLPFKMLVKWIGIALLAIFLQGGVSTQAQVTTSGTDFWLTFGLNYLHYVNAGTHIDSLNLQVRIVSRDKPTTGTIYFTHLGTWKPFNLLAGEVFTYDLTYSEKEAVYNISSGVSDLSIHITSTEPITAYALNQVRVSTDATNILPITALGTDYYQMSYIPRPSSGAPNDALDAYAVIATETNTQVYHINGTTPVAILDAGEVYYHTSATDMTGYHIFTDKPVAFFALNQGVLLPAGSSSGDCLMQQLAPVNTWGNTFFVPVSDLTTPLYTDTKDRVRIVASQNNTVITPPAGATLITNSGGSSNFTIHQGQFIELEVTLNNNGCYIQSSKPIGVCTYLTSGGHNNGLFSDPAQAWLSSIEQAVSEALIAPFIPTGTTAITAHYALIITPTSSKDQTTVSIGGMPATGLNDNNWRDHAEAGMSFYNMALTDQSASYLYANPKGLIVMCYATGNAESYYYLAYSGMRNLQTAFYANDIHYQDLQAHTFCSGEIDFRGQAQGMSSEPGSLKWYIDGIERVNVRDSLEWSDYFAVGDYEVQMMVRFSEEDSVVLEAPLHVGYDVLATASPPEGGEIDGIGCYKPNEEAVLTAIPNLGYNFIKWTEDGGDISTQEILTFIVTESREFVAHFEPDTYSVILSANPPEGGVVLGADSLIPHGTSVTVEAIPNDTAYKFVNWTEYGTVVSTTASYTFNIIADRNLVANFALLTHDITLSADPADGGTVSGGGNNIPHGSIITVSATAIAPYIFVNWTEEGVPIYDDASYTFTVTESRNLVANFSKSYYHVNVEVNEPDYGYATGAGDYFSNATAKVEAFVNSCYRFYYWTIKNDTIYDNPYIFTVTDHVNLVANFYALDFDTYSPTLWDNTFLLNLRRLREEGYEVIGCQWFKNGTELKETNTINEFSYSAGPNDGDLLELSPTYYMFRLLTKNFGPLCSTKKTLTEYHFDGTGNLLVHPNPVSSGVPFTIEGVSKDSPIYVYNHFGACVYSTVATEKVVRITLNLPSGIYLIRSGNKVIKIVVVE